MVKKIKKFILKHGLKRSTVLSFVMVAMAFILIHRLFTLQIVNGEDYVKNFNLKTTKTRTVKSTRGNIYDCNGNVLASNELSYSITLEDNGSYDTTKERNLSLNGEIFRIMKIVEEQGDFMTSDFRITLDENGNFIFDAEGVTLSRFRADVYGRAKIEQMTAAEKASSADKIMNDLAVRFCIFEYNDKPYTPDELSKYGLPENITKSQQLTITIVRYLLHNTSYQKYMPVTVASNVSDKTVAAILENQSLLQGIGIEEDTRRVYTDSVYFASIIGYTGKPSSEELEELSEISDEYNTTSIIGKAGIEQYMETTLQGKEGSETVKVDSLGKVLEIDESSRKIPQQGNDVYLTIDKELQIAAYKILEQRIAGILIKNITNIKELDPDEEYDGSAVPIPIYDVYFALINNSLIDISHFSEEGATAKEQEVYGKFQQKQAAVFDQIKDQLTGASPLAYKDLSKEMQNYFTYIVDELLIEKTGILSETAMDKTDEIYMKYAKDETISLQEFLTYAASQNWIDISVFITEEDKDTYLNSSDVYQRLAEYISNYLSTDLKFSKMLYHYLLLDDVVSGRDLGQILFDQGILEKDSLYDRFSSRSINAQQLMIEAITNLKITPAELALEPCSGSIVITDPNTGALRACVSYPGYDNNRLANQMDVSYYRQLLNDLSEPLYNKATQERTAPGSTFKPVTAIAGLMESVINTRTEVFCNGVFEVPELKLRCWKQYGHNALNVKEGITNSCNVFFCDLMYNLGKNGTDNYSENTALQKLNSYMSLFNLDKKTGIEISEASPHISDQMAIPSGIGQGTHNYTTTQLARYVTTLANSGTSFNLSLLSKVTDADGKVLQEFGSNVESKLDVPDYIWDEVQEGMRGVITETNSKTFGDLEVEVAGKTGTAQQVGANHGLFVGYAPYKNPEMAIAIRIAHGYSSSHAALVAKDVFNYYFNLKDESEIITGSAVAGNVSTGQTD